MNVIDRFSKWYFTKGAVPYMAILSLDILTVLCGGYLARYLDVGGYVFTATFWPYTWGLLVSAVLFACAFRYHHTYSGIIRYSSFVDLRRCLYATLTGSVLLLACGWLAGNFPALEDYVIIPSPFSVLVIFIFSTLSMWLARVVVKSAFDTLRSGDNVEKAVVFGIKEGGVALAKSIRNQDSARYELAGFVNPDGGRSPRYLMDVRVYDDSAETVEALHRAGVKAMFVSPIQTTAFREKEDFVNALIDAGIRILIMPEFEIWDGKSSISQSALKEVEIEDLLPRDKIEINMEAIRGLLSGKTILVTGAAGSIGGEMVRQVASFKPSHLVLIDQAETPMHDLRLMMAEKFPDLDADTIVASITDREYMEHIFSRCRPDYVFHAAAYKHVPMMEDNPVEAVRNNVVGTRIMADLAVKYGTKKFVMVSTDKAVNPTNVMGCSKRICEIYCQSLNRAVETGAVKGCTQFVTTRFGNVLGSNGSVVPLFKRQIRSGGPLTVTHPEVIRYFMLIIEACKLVLEAGTMGHGGEIFVFDMGKPVRIVDLAKRMIALSGAKDVKIKFTGLRAGEKLYEEVLSDKENTVPTVHPKIMVAKVVEYDYAAVCADEERLVAAASSFDAAEVVRIMKEMVPEYKSE